MGIQDLISYFYRTTSLDAKENFNQKPFVRRKNHTHLICLGNNCRRHDLISTLGKQKIILFGTSWGSALGVKIATKRPDLFYAYVGHSQIVNPSDDQKLYEKVYKLAQKANDTTSLTLLNNLRKPPYDRARSMGQLFRIVKKYERLKATPAPEQWFIPSSAYDNPKDEQNRSDGDDYSFVNYTGDSKLGVKAIRSGINLVQDNPDFKIPVYLI